MSNKVELFGHIVYSPELSYHDLLAREEEVKALLQGVLENVGGEFIHFEALGDSLRFQCAFAEENNDTFHHVLDAMAPNIKKDVDARVLLVDKDLDTLYYYSIANGRWQEAVVGLPPAGYLAEAEPVVVRKIQTDHDKPKKKK